MRERQTIKTVALPAAGASASTAALDFGAALPGPQKIELALELPALPNLANTKKCILALEDSADNVTFAAIPGTGNMEVVGAASAGSAAKTFRVNLPPVFRRYVRATATVEADGGSNVASSLTLAVEL